MLARALRTALFTALALALWTVALPARAASFAPAPFCDDRGATALAPPPILEPTDEALLRLAAPAADGGDDGAPARATFAPGRRLASSSSAEVAAVRPPALPVIAPSPAMPLVSLERAAAPHAGVRFRIERPPRG